MSDPRSQKPNEGESRGLSAPVIGVTLGLAAFGWMVALWLQRVFA